MMMRAMPMRPLAFKADHPFCFFIYDKELEVTLFAGRLVKPEPSKEKEEL